MQDIRKYIDLIEDKQEPQVGDAFDIEFGNDNRAIISSVIEQIDNDSIILRADEKAMSFISNLEESCCCEMPQEETAEKDHEVGMGKSQMYHAMKNAKAIHDMLQQVSEREGIEGWVASKLTKASDYLKVVKDYLEYEMVQAGFDKNLPVVQSKETPADSPDVDEAKYQGREVKLGKRMRGDVKKFKVYVRDPKTGNVKKVNFGDPNMRIKKSNPARRKSFRARHNCDNPGPRTKARYWSCRAW